MVEETGSGVGVLDKTVAILDALATGPHSVADLSASLDMSRPTVHRLVQALEHHQLASRQFDGTWELGFRLIHWARSSSTDRLVAEAQPVLERLRDETGESAQLYQRLGQHRLCVATAERGSGLRDTVPVGSLLPMTAGSAAQILLAWNPDDWEQFDMTGAAFHADVLARVRKRGWAESVAEREPGVASVSAPVRTHSAPPSASSTDGNLARTRWRVPQRPREPVAAAISVSGPIERLSTEPGQRLSTAVVLAGKQLGARLASSEVGG